MTRFSIFGLLLLIIGLTAPLPAQPVNHNRLVYSHPLTSGQAQQGETILNDKGLFDPQMGWQAVDTTSQLQIIFPRTLPAEGTLAIRVTNFNPAEQWVRDLKLHIINLYSRLYTNNKDIFESDGSWINIRTGSGYSGGAGMAGFKTLAAARGIDTREEFTALEDYIWKLGRIYEFRISWTPGKVYVALDGNTVTTLDFTGQVEPFKYLLIGRDNLIWGYCAQPGPYYFDLRIYEPGTAADITPPSSPLNVRVTPLAQPR